MLLDALGVAALAVALSAGGHASRHPTVSNPAPVLVAHPQDPLTRTVPLTTPSAAPRRPKRKHHRLAPASAGVQTDRQGSVSPAALAGSFSRFAASQPGAVGLAVAPLGQGDIITFGNLQVGHAWSTMKVPVLTTLLAELERGGGRLSAAQQDDAARALTASDNSAAEALFSGLEASDGGLAGASAAVQSTLRRAGDGSAVVNTAPNSGGFTTWGQSEWSASGEVAFYRALARGCLLSSTDSAYVLGLMRNVESDQRWGAGSANLPAPVAFKGGWGPEDGGGYLVRQSAIAGSGAHGYVFSMLAKPSDGSFATGTVMLTNIAGWVSRTIPPSLGTAAGGC